MGGLRAALLFAIAGAAAHAQCVAGGLRQWS